MRIIAYSLSLLFPLLISFALAAQKKTEDSTSLKKILQKGTFGVQARSFFMSTLNEGALKDDAALAVSAAMRYETPVRKGFSVAMGGAFIMNAASTDLAKADAITGQKNRYEIGLFDITGPSGKKGLARMEELLLKYQRRKTTVTIGRQFVNTPFINKQDGRMRPTMVQGLWLKTGWGNRWSLDAGWLNRMSPRTTTGWYSIGESIGIYPPGVNSDGTKSGYAGHTSSKGILLTGIQYKTEQWQVHAWNTWVENIMNTIQVQPEITMALTEKQKLKLGLQFIYQSGSGNGGNAEPSKTYYEPGHHTWLISTQMARETDRSKTSLNYSHISHTGRFLMPREWGREFFYTFMQRERNEGLGGVNAFTLSQEFQSRRKQWKWAVGYGRYYLPAPDNARLNKYGMPSYQQLNLLTEYRFKGWLSNMDIQLLLVLKDQLGSTPLKPVYINNRVNMFNTNLILNYHF